MAASAGPGWSEVVILLLGEKQSGKSSVGNSILDRPAFHKHTKCSCKESSTVFGIKVTVVDTPGWSSHSTTPHQVSEEICRGLTLCEPRPHVILLVLSTTDAFGQGEWRAMEAHLRVLHMPIWQQAMILFTHGDSLGALSIEEHIRTQSRTLSWLLERCGNRYHMMSNQPRGPGSQVKGLLSKIHRILEDNNYPREMRYEMYTKLRLEVSLTEERRTQRGEEEVEMTMMCDMYDGRRWQNQSMNSDPVYKGPADLKPPLGLILLGRRKSGKSSSGNMILDKDVFKTNTKTVRCCVGRGVVGGRSVTVVDTPGWSLFGLADPQKVKAELKDSPSHCPAGGQVVFLLAIPVASFKEKDRRAVDEYVGAVGPAVWRNTVVLFTYGDELRGRTTQMHVEDTGHALQWVMDRCGQRHHVFDTNVGDKKQVLQILDKVQQI